MKAKLPLPRCEEAIRHLATVPHVNAWVEANAGAGKTTILRNRVIRLLLKGVAADHILCLTFTRAAAAEMQTRIFAELSRWVGLDDAALRAAITEIAGADAVDLHHARALFAEAVETPGGLKLQTIHAFAERILHLFPLEAGVPVDFTVLEEADARALTDAARRAVLEAASLAPHSAPGRAFGVLVTATGLDGFARAIEGGLRALIAARNADPDAAMPDDAYAALFATPPDLEEAALDATLIKAAPDAAGMIEALGPVAGRATTATLHALNSLDAAQGVADMRAALHALCLTKGGMIRKAMLEAAVIKAHPDIAAALDDLKAVVAADIEQRRALHALNRSRALQRFTQQVLAYYEAAKKARSALDFDDLITKLRILLASGKAAWVMMKLDAAIDHILVDEAQDTTPAMWEIITGLAGDFFAGEGQRKATRTIFVVGDEKQSIFSFQGAEPQAFDAARRHFSESIKPFAAKNPEVDQVSKPVRLLYSFRSSQDVLDAVDHVLAAPEHAAGLSFSGAKPEHHSAFDRFPGEVALWPLEEPPEKLEEPDPDAPVDAPRPRHQALRMAERIADQIALWLQTGARHAADGTRIRPEDILILVQQRNIMFNAVLRALKQRKIPVSGADRLKLSEEIAIDDLLAIARAALPPEDDLTLASVLKSPFFALDDAMLEALCRNREGSLRAAIRDAAQQSPALSTIDRRLNILEMLARSAAPFTFFAECLTAPIPHAPGISGRKALLTRLGLDAADAVDAFLADSLTFSQKNPASLLAFVEAAARRDTDIKRDLDQGAGQVRVMTVHAAKGLEARIVFLCDAAALPNRGKEAPAFLMAGQGGPLLVWAGKKSDEPEVMRAARDVAHQQRLAEYRRLFYVGMTRAADQLIIAAYRHGRKPKDGAKKAAEPTALSWYGMAEAAFAGNPRVQSIERADGGVILAWKSALPAAPPHEDAAKPEATDEALPAWLTTALLPEAAPDITLRPSQRRSEAETGFGARQRGILIHRLYELLPDHPPEIRQNLGRNLIMQAAPMLDEAAAAALLAPVLSALSAPVFGPGSRGEVAIKGEITLPNGARTLVSARLDRLWLREDAVILLDIKTGTSLQGEKNADIMRQMALYRAVLKALYPRHSIIPTLLWHAAGRFETLPEAALDAAFSAITAA